MKSIKFLAFAISVCTSLPLMMAQQVNSQAQEALRGHSRKPNVSQSANGDANAKVNPGNAQAGGSAASSLTASSPRAQTIVRLSNGGRKRLRLR